MSVGVGKRRQKEVLANRSGARDREENKNALHAEPVELPAKMLEDAVGSAADWQTHPGACSFIALELKDAFYIYFLMVR